VTLSKREKVIAGVAALFIAGPILNSIVIEPLQSRNASLNSDIAAAQNELERTSRLFDTSKSARREWASMAGTALYPDRPRAESQILNHVREWAQEAGISLNSQKPERDEKEKEFQRITFRVTASGTMSQVGRFLHRIQTATIPVRITDLQLSSHRDGQDGLSLSVALATIYMPPQEQNKPGAGRTIAGMEVGR
jgi:hypothetical protein